MFTNFSRISIFFFQGTNGISSKDVKILMEHGFHTVDSVAHALKKTLVAIKDISDAKADKLQAAAKKFGEQSWQRSTQYLFKQNFTF